MTTKEVNYVDPVTPEEVTEFINRVYRIAWATRRDQLSDLDLARILATSTALVHIIVEYHESKTEE